MKILGIDPGTTRIGFGAIENGADLKLVDYGILDISGKDKMLSMAESYAKLLKKFRPDLVAVEKLFFAKNKKTALAVAESRGIILLKTKEVGVALVEYTPLQIKTALTGYGMSDKQAVAFMVKKFLKINNLQGHDDASDALAVAITAANRWKMDSAGM
ncbi:MAG: crossover junction endodeoxyribonuclease RuvC [Patescibacteria group bacterium]